MKARKPYQSDFFKKGRRRNFAEFLVLKSLGPFTPSGIFLISPNNCMLCADDDPLKYTGNIPTALGQRPYCYDNRGFSILDDTEASHTDFF